jgi:hypothetical protein
VQPKEPPQKQEGAGWTAKLNRKTRKGTKDKRERTRGVTRGDSKRSERGNTIRKARGNTSEN